MNTIKRVVAPSGPLIEVNCAAIPSELIESELFGSEKGSFTSAIKQRIGKFDFGATVGLLETQSDQKKQYTLVGQDEADLKDGKISVQSPVGRALIGKRVGDLVEVTTPAKVVEYEVLNIRFDEL